MEPSAKNEIFFHYIIWLQDGCFGDITRLGEYHPDPDDLGPFLRVWYSWEGADVDGCIRVIQFSCLPVFNRPQLSSVPLGLRLQILVFNRHLQASTTLKSFHVFTVVIINKD